MRRRMRTCDRKPIFWSYSRKSLNCLPTLTWAASLAASLVHRQILSCLPRRLTTMPQISSPSVNCSPMHASSCSAAHTPVFKLSQRNTLMATSCVFGACHGRPRRNAALHVVTHLMHGSTRHSDS